MARQMTITLDDDVAEKLEREARRKGEPIAVVANEKLRAVAEDAPKARTPFRVYARDLEARPGFDFECAWKLLGDEDAERLK
jgi:hypothetical protein